MYVSIVSSIMKRKPRRIPRRIGRISASLDIIANYKRALIKTQEQRNEDDFKTFAMVNNRMYPTPFTPLPTDLSHYSIELLPNMCSYVPSTSNAGDKVRAECVMKAVQYVRNLTLTMVHEALSLGIRILASSKREYAATLACAVNPLAWVYFTNLINFAKRKTTLHQVFLRCATLASEERIFHIKVRVPHHAVYDVGEEIIRIVEESKCVTELSKSPDRIGIPAIHVMWAQSIEPVHYEDDGTMTDTIMIPQRHHFESGTYTALDYDKPIIDEMLNIDFMLHVPTPPDHVVDDILMNKDLDFRQTLTMNPRL